MAPCIIISVITDQLSASIMHLEAAYTLKHDYTIPTLT